MRSVIPLYGVFMDSLGRKFAMITGCSIFGLGTLMCALSPNIYFLIAARAVAGVSVPSFMLYEEDADKIAWGRRHVDSVGCYCD